MELSNMQKRAKLRIFFINIDREESTRADNRSLRSKPYTPSTRDRPTGRNRRETIETLKHIIGIGFHRG